VEQYHERRVVRLAKWLTVTLGAKDGLD
jgi:hypothetical protein